MKRQVIFSFFLILSLFGSIYSEEWKELYKVDPINQARTQMSEYDLDEIDPISGYSFRELIQETQDTGVNLIIAQATYTDDQAREIKKTYEAIALFRHLFGPNFIYPIEHRYNIPSENFPKKDPISRQPYKGSIDLFLINNDSEEGKYIGNDFQLHSEPSSQQATEIAKTLLESFSSTLIDEYLKKSKELYEQIQNEDNPDIANAKFRELSPHLFILSFKRETLNQDNLQFIDTAINALIERDFKTASTYLIPTVEQNINQEAKARAQYLLGKMYYDGQGVQQNYQTALNYLQPAAEQNINQFAKADAANLLARMYYVGHGVPQNYQPALYYLQSAFEQNINQPAKAAAQYVLSMMYYNGQGVQQNYQTALYYLQPAAEQNINQSAKAAALLDLGMMYYKGQGVQQNYQTALNYLQPAAELTKDKGVKASAEKLIQEIQARISEEPPTKKRKISD